METEQFEKAQRDNATKQSCGQNKIAPASTEIIQLVVNEISWQFSTEGHFILWGCVNFEILI
jgi:hypothetical protein